MFTAQIKHATHPVLSVTYTHRVCSATECQSRHEARKYSAASDTRPLWLPTLEKSVTQGPPEDGTFVSLSSPSPGPSGNRDNALPAQSRRQR